VRIVKEDTSQNPYGVIAPDHRQMNRFNPRMLNS
jgi:hypothetical protein